MSSFNARLRLPGHSRLPLGVEVDILNERMTLTAGERTVANWPLDQLEIVVRADGFHIRVDGEEMVLNVTDSKAFAAALGVEAAPARPIGAAAGQTSTSLRPTMLNQPSDAELDDLRRRISAFARDLAANAVPPEEVFARWLRLLKEINRRLGEGSLPTSLFYQLNTHLLELMPEPAPAPATV
ncbi:MAG TPA: hypothetical protein VFU96_01530 [Acidimicrobiia bacterium]|nr:hypothetical protein [Acidimicrobiia bacterium]